MVPDDEYITSTEAARVAGVSRQRIVELAQEGRIGRQIARQYWIFTREEIEAYVEQARQNKGGRHKVAPPLELRKRERPRSVT